MIDSVFPQAFVIGANKSGTSTLCGILEAHPDVCVSDPKEPCTFSDSSKSNQLQAEYSTIFASDRPGLMRVEGSTTYSRWPYKPTRWHPTLQDPWPAIAEHSPDSKVVYLVRHPVDRIVSQINHRLREGNSERLTMEAILDRSPTYLDDSRYRTQIEHIRPFVPEDRWFVETFDRFNRDRHTVVEEILDFLDLPRILSNSKTDLHDNKAGVHHLLSKRIRALPGAGVLQQIVPKPIRRRFMKQLLRGPIDRRLHEEIAVDPMMPETRSRLIETLEPDIRMIESILGRDLPDWRR